MALPSLTSSLYWAFMTFQTHLALPIGGGVKASGWALFILHVYLSLATMYAQRVFSERHDAFHLRKFLDTYREAHDSAPAVTETQLELLAADVAGGGHDV